MRSASKYVCLKGPMWLALSTACLQQPCHTLVSKVHCWSVVGTQRPARAKHTPAGSGTHISGPPCLHHLALMLGNHALVIQPAMASQPITCAPRFLGAWSCLHAASLVFTRVWSPATGSVFQAECTKHQVWGVALATDVISASMVSWAWANMRRCGAGEALPMDWRALSKALASLPSTALGYLPS